MEDKASINFPTSAERKEHGSEDPVRNPSLLFQFCLPELKNHAECLIVESRKQLVVRLNTFKGEPISLDIILKR